MLSTCSMSVVFLSLSGHLIELKYIFFNKCLSEMHISLKAQSTKYYTKVFLSMNKTLLNISIYTLNQTFLLVISK